MLAVGTTHDEDENENYKQSFGVYESNFFEFISALIRVICGPIAVRNFANMNMKSGESNLEGGR